jgi:hypothetical protein
MSQGDKVVRKESLEDYQIHEEESKKKFELAVREGTFRFDKEDIFPSENRFVKLGKPYAMAYPVPDVGIWPQVPLFRSLIIPINPVKESQFEESHGFGPALIPKLVDYCKETGRIQFVLENDPITYLSLDFLDPILTELKPPRRRPMPIDSLGVDRKTLIKWGDEFSTLASFKVYPIAKRLIEKGAGYYDPRLLITLESTYLSLRAKKFERLVCEIDNSLVDDPVYALVLLVMLGSLLINPQLDPLKPVGIFPREVVAMAEKFGLPNTPIKLPCEIGSFLMKNLTYLPVGFEACKDVIARYDRRDLYSAMNALCEGISNKNLDLVATKSAQLDETLKLVYEESGSVQTKATFAKYLISVSMGAVGLLLNPLVGLLGSFGYIIVDNILEEDSLSERISRLMSRGNTITIFDFKKKYGLDRRPIVS